MFKKDGNLIVQLLSRVWYFNFQRTPQKWMHKHMLTQQKEWVNVQLQS